MKKLLFQTTLAIFAIFCAGNVMAQDLTVTHTTEGDFATELTAALAGADPLTITNLTITSDGADMSYPDFVSMRTTLTNVETVDISAVTVAADKLPTSGAYEPNGSFTGLKKLKSVVLPASLVTLGGGAFNGCSVLETVNLPSTLKTIESYAFKNCPKLVLTELPESVTSILQEAFLNCEKIALASLPSGITVINQFTFSGCKELTLSSLPSGITLIAQQGFLNCAKITASELPANLKTLGAKAFDGCTNVTFSTWPLDINSIGNDVFRNTKVTFTTFPESAKSVTDPGKSIPDGLFVGSSTITDFTIPEYITDLYQRTFYPGGFARTFTCKATTAPNTDLGATGATYPTFGPTNAANLEQVTLKVLRKAYDSFANKSPWSLMQIETITRNVTVTVTGNGTVEDAYDYADIAGGVLVAYEGDDVTFTLAPTAGWSVSELKLNGEDVKDDLVGTSYTIPALGAEDYTLDVTFDFSSGIGENKGDASVSIYPNPTTDVITVSGNVSSDIKLYDSTGHQLIRTNESTVDVSSFNSGVYLLKVDGKTFKVIKK